MAKKHSREWWQELRPERIGKETEIIVEGLLDELNRRQGFAYHRMPDAKAARGIIAAQPADYLWFHNGWGGFLEVKATKHEFRLAKDKVSQLPTLKMFDMAKARNYVLVHHYMEGIWRIVPTSMMETGVPSWDLRPFSVFASAEEALASTGVFQ